MKALCWYGTEDVRIAEVPNPTILQPTDAVIEVTSTAICGSDLHIYDGFVPMMRKGDILGHEAMGIVREVGKEVTSLAPGDRVVVPFPIACGKCWYCQNQQYSLCDNTNPDATVPETLYGGSTAGIYGYSHAFGGFAGGQAEYLRVPYADQDHIKVPESLSDEQVLFLSDALPTGWMAADLCGIKPGDSVAVWGAGPVGLFAMQAARSMGAAQVFAIDKVDHRLQIAHESCGAIPIDRRGLNSAELLHELKIMTGGRAPDAVIDAVGTEATDGLLGAYHKAKQAVRLEQDRPVALHEAIMACGKGGTVSVAGVYTGMVDKFPMGAVFEKSLTLKGGQAPVQRYAPELLKKIVSGEIDPTFVVTHRLALEQAPEAYRMFRDDKEHVLKVVLQP